MDGRNATSGFISLGTQNAVGGTKCRAVVSTNAGSTILDVTTTGVIVDNTSHHVLFTMDASGNYVIYVDGISDLTGSLVSDTDPLDTWTGIGSLERTTNTQFFTGNIAEVANWSRQLSAVEAAQLVGGLPASQLVPDHYWPLRGVASPESDVGTVGGADGTLTGTTSIVGPPEVDYTTFYPSLASRRPVPMIKGPDKESCSA
jgi:hypothetical protein